jgi:hypothetical protein
MKLPKQSASISQEFEEIRYGVMASSIQERGVGLSGFGRGGGGGGNIPAPPPPSPPSPPPGWTGQCAAYGQACSPNSWTFSQYCEILYGSQFPLACVR